MKEELRKYFREYRLAHKESIMASQKKWRKSKRGVDWWKNELKRRRELRAAGSHHSIAPIVPTEDKKPE